MHNLRTKQNLEKMFHYTDIGTLFTYMNTKTNLNKSYIETNNKVLRIGITFPLNE